MSSALQLTNKQFLTSRKEDIELKLHDVCMRLQSLAAVSSSLSVQYTNQIAGNDDPSQLAPGAALSNGAANDALIGINSPYATVGLGSNVSSVGTAINPAITPITFLDGAGVSRTMTYEQATVFIAAQSKALELKQNDLQAQFTEVKTEVDSVDKIMGEDIKKEYSYAGQ